MWFYKKLLTLVNLKNSVANEGEMRNSEKTITSNSVDWKRAKFKCEFCSTLQQKIRELINKTKKIAIATLSLIKCENYCKAQSDNLIKNEEIFSRKRK